jgi:hypothetical protein
MLDKKDATAEDKLFAPLHEAFNSRKINKRKCSKITDLNHLLFGIKRVSNFFTSGRGFVQKQRDSSKGVDIELGSYFKSLKSERREIMISQVNEVLIDNYNSPVEEDPFSGVEALDGYAIYAADGHFIKHATQEKKHKNGKHYPVGHIYAISLRNQTMRLLDVLRPTNKKENEAKALQRLGNQLRMGEPKGRRVIISYDRASIDFPEWHKRKQSKGVYFVTRSKSSLKLTICGLREFDKYNPVNAGVISDELVGGANSVLIRRVKYYDSESNKEYTFITNVMDIPPGAIAFIYKVRWNIEKVFDVFKNKFYENKAWGASYTAKCQQASFICITHNLILMLEIQIEKEDGIADDKIIRKREKEMKKVIEEIIENNRPLNSLATQVLRSVQRSCQFLRNLETAINESTCWEGFIVKLRPNMEKYLS